MSESFLSLENGVLFVEKGSRVRVTPPRGPGVEPYHLHLLYRVAGELHDYPLGQGKEGLVELDLAKFERPEKLVVASGSLHAERRDRGVHEGAVLPPYALSFRLVPREELFLVSLQDFHYAVRTEFGPLAVLVQPATAGDMLVTYIDPTKSLGVLIEENPYIYLPAEDAYVIPRLVVDILEADGRNLLQRSGTWPLPEEVRRMKREDRPFVFRTPRRELLAFPTPPGVDLAWPAEPQSTSARVEASFLRLGDKDDLRLVLAGAYPAAGGKKDYSARLQTHSVSSGHGPAPSVYLLDASHLEASRFPVTVAAVNRFVRPWRTQGGRYLPRPPRGVSEVSLKASGEPPKFHPNVILPRHASHFEWITFVGKGETAGSAGPFRAKTSGPSPNLIPPGTGIPPGAGPPPGGPTPALPPDPTLTPGGGPAPNGRQGGVGAAGDDRGNDRQGPAPAGEILLNLFCPPKPQGCGQSEANCRCIPHLWEMPQVMDLVRQGIPGMCDYSWAGLHGDFAPCHRKTPIGRIRLSAWGQGFQLIQNWFEVSVRFGPCHESVDPPPKKKKDLKKPVINHKDPKDDPKEEEQKEEEKKPKRGPDVPSVDRFKPRTVSITDSPDGEPEVDTSGERLIPPSSFVYNDPSLGIRLDEITEALALDGRAQPTVSLPIWSFNPETLGLAVQVRASRDQALLDAYYARRNPENPPTILSDPDTGPGSAFPFFIPGIGALPGDPGGGTGCGALGLEFVLVAGLLALLKRKIIR